MAKNFGYTQFFSYIVRYLSKADASEHIIFYGARDLKVARRIAFAQARSELCRLRSNSALQNKRSLRMI